MESKVKRLEGTGLVNLLRRNLIRRHATSAGKAQLQGFTRHLSSSYVWQSAHGLIRLSKKILKQRFFLVLIAIFCFSTPVQACQLDYVFGADPYTLNSGYGGDFFFNAFPESFYGGRYVYDRIQGSMGTGVPWSGFTYSADAGSLNSITTISANMDYYITTTSNMPGDVYFDSELILYIYDTSSKTGTSFSSNGQISHALNSTTQISFSNKINYSFIHGNEYVIDFTLFSFEPSWRPGEDTFLRDLKIIYTNWGGEFGHVNGSWQGTTSLSYEHKPLSAVPEPATALLLALGLSGLAAVSRRLKS